MTQDVELSPSAPEVVKPTASSKARVRTAATLVLIMVAVAGGCYWLTHPTAVGEYGNGIGVTLGVGETVLVDGGVYTDSGFSPTSRETITVLGAVPRVVENRADADIELIMCQHDWTGTDIIGSVMADEFDAYCTAEVPVADTEAMFPVTAQLLLRITPHQAGTVRVEGIDLSYRQGIQRATVHTGIETTTTTT